MTDNRRWQRDGWNATTRIGVVVPHADVGPEAELQAMAPPGVTIHASRLHFGAMRAGGVMDPKIPHAPVQSFTEEPFVDDAVELLAASPLDVIALGFTSSTYKHGYDGELALIERLTPRARNLPIVSTCLAATAGLRALGVGKLALVNPPWFDDDLAALGGAFFESQGFAMVHMAPADIPSSQADVTPERVFDWVCSVAGGAEGVFIAGNGFRAVGVIDALERELGIPVLTANQVLLWQALTVLGGAPNLTGFGRLFEGESTVAAV
jgi:maleate isomerase